MPSSVAATPAPKEARPVPWLGVSLALCVLAGGWTVIGAGAAEPVRLGILWLGLLAGGIGVQRAFAAEFAKEPVRAPGALLGLACVFAALSVGVTVVLVASWLGHRVLGLRPSLAFIAWFLVGPMSARAAWQSFSRARAKPVFERRDRAAVGLILASVSAFIGCFALTPGEAEPAAGWATIQHFLFVLGLVALAAAPLTTVDEPTRRFVISGLALFHLLGLLTASLASPPSPWLLQQAWTRIYRPYLQFMYLNNAYHFYSPEPGAANHLWFRLYYTDAADQPQGEWFKIPRLSDRGQHEHSTSLEYQRTLSMTDNTMPTETIVGDSDWFAKIAERRLTWTPEGAKQAVVGRDPSKQVLVPMHPTVTKSQQYQVPQPQIKRVLESYARHVLHKHAVQHPERKYMSVRIYRVVHAIPPKGAFFQGLEATDPEFYTPIYLGEYGTDGKLMRHEEDNPLLYWVLPIVRVPPGDLHSPIYDYARKHAGDPYWTRIVRDGFAEWVDEDNRPAPR